MSIHICTHAFAGKLPQYAVFLRAQLSSLVLYPPECDWKVTVCFANDDLPVFNVLVEFKQMMGESLDCQSMVRGYLFRRAIGRNQAAKSCRSDLFWATDVDHVFGPGCLDDLYETWRLLPKKPSMVWPNQILIHKTHEIGDQFWKSNLEKTGMIDINPDDFEPKTYHDGIGGIQIINGDYARRHGYLSDQEKWLVPVSPEKPFPEFRDDCKFRNLVKYRGSVVKISQIAQLYRLRHTAITYRGP